MLHLVQLEGDHAEGSEHTLRRTRDGDDAFGTRSLRDVDPCSALRGRGQGARGCGKLFGREQEGGRINAQKEKCGDNMGGREEGYGGGERENTLVEGSLEEERGEREHGRRATR